MANPLTVMPEPKIQFFDNDGNPLDGGLVTFWRAGTSTLLDTYSDSAGTPNTNPVELDSAGRHVVFWSANTYKVRLQKSDGTIVWTVDGVPSTGLSQSIVGIGGTVYNFGGSEYTPITATSYPSGTSFQTCHADTGILSIDSSLLVGTFALSGMIYGTSGATVTAALVNLSDGSPDTPLVTIASASTTGALVVSSAISFPTAGVAKDLAIKTKASSSANRGPAFDLQLVRIA